jgi:hypothetical protein
MLSFNILSVTLLTVMLSVLLLSVTFLIVMLSVTMLMVAFFTVFAVCHIFNCYAVAGYVECCILNGMQSVIMLSVPMPSVVAPKLVMRLHHSPDGSTFPRFKLTCFVYNIYFSERINCTSF